MDDADSRTQAWSWERGRKGAIFGTVVGMNAWIFILAILALSSGVPIWPNILLVLVWNIAMTLVVLLTTELAARKLGQSGMRPVIFGMILFAIGTALFLWSVALEPELMQNEQFQKTMRDTGSITHVPVWVGPLCILASFVPLWIAYRAIARTDVEES